MICYYEQKEERIKLKKEAKALKEAKASKITREGLYLVASPASFVRVYWPRSSGRTAIKNW